MLVILLFIIILNIVSIVLMYYCLGELGKKEKIIFIAAGTAIMYMLTSFVYWLSTKDIEITSVSERGKDLITFLFVPINGLITLPLLAKSYFKYKIGGIDMPILRNRAIVILILLVIILVIECTYFKNIQQQVVDLLIEQQSTQKTTDAMETAGNVVGNSLEDIETVNQTTNEAAQNSIEVQKNEVLQGNQITEVVVNDTVNESLIRNNIISNENIMENNSVSNENVVEINE